MFTRTLAVSLGEVRQPSSSAQCLRAASTAGAILAGYFPHLRGAFSFPPHLAGVRSLTDTPQCSVTQHNPQIASLLSVQEQTACETEPEYQGASTPRTKEDRDAVRTSVVETLMAREYGPKMGRLEQKCLALYAANQQLRWDAEQAQTKSEKTRDLNRRLCREVSESRSERTVALEELERVKHQSQKLQEEIKRVRSENLSLREGLKDFELKVSELSRPQPVAHKQDQTITDTLQNEIGSITTIQDALLDQGPDASFLMVPADPEAMPCISEDLHSDTMCKCTSKSAWGCPVHRVYSDSLLLAHREIASRISMGPPGLEMELPPGLECMGKLDVQPSSQSGLCLVPA